MQTSVCRGSPAGDIRALQSARGLQEVDLSKSKVSGDIKSLKNAKGLLYLDISGTSSGGFLATQRVADLQSFRMSLQGVLPWQHPKSENALNDLSASMQIQYSRLKTRPQGPQQRWSLIIEGAFSVYCGHFCHVRREKMISQAA